MGVHQERFLVRFAFGGEESPEYRMLADVASGFSFVRRHKLVEQDLEIVVNCEVKHCEQGSMLSECIRNTKNPYALQRRPVEFVTHSNGVPQRMIFQDHDQQFAGAVVPSRETDLVEWLKCIKQRSDSAYHNIGYRTRIYLIGQTMEGQRLPKYIKRISYSSFQTDVYRLISFAASRSYHKWLRDNPLPVKPVRSRPIARQKVLV